MWGSCLERATDTRRQRLEQILVAMRDSRLDLAELGSCLSAYREFTLSVHPAVEPELAMYFSEFTAGGLVHREIFEHGGVVEGLCTVLHERSDEFDSDLRDRAFGMVHRERARLQDAAAAMLEVLQEPPRELGPGELPDRYRWWRDEDPDA